MEKKGGCEFNVWTELFFTANHNFFFHKDIGYDYEDECDDFQDELSNFEQIFIIEKATK